MVDPAFLFMAQAYVVRLRFNNQTRYNDLWRILTINAPRFDAAKNNYSSNFTPEFEAFKKMVTTKSVAGDYSLTVRLNFDQYRYFVNHQNDFPNITYIMGDSEKTFWNFQDDNDDWVQFNA
jgi:hypothetical protein